MLQRSDEWFEARLGKLTASRYADAVARTKSGWGASRARYAAELAVERMTGEREEGYRSASMDWGTTTEDLAADQYAFLFDAELHKVGFVNHPTIEMAGASPDRLVGDEGMIEIKCPDRHTHFGYLTSKSVDGKYVKQMNFQMICAGRKWCDFISFDPRVPPALQMYVKRFYCPQLVSRDEINEEAIAFLTQVDNLVAQLNQFDMIKEYYS